MNQVQKLLARGNDKLTAAYPGEVSIDGNSYEVSTAGLTTVRETEVGGYMLEVDFSFMVKKNLLAFALSDGKIITYNGQKFRVIKVTGEQSSHWTVDCQDPNK